MRATLIYGAGDVRVETVPDPKLHEPTAPQYAEVPADVRSFLRNITLTGGVAPARAYIEELLPDILDGRIQPGRVFDRTIGLEEVPSGYRAMADREALKVLIRP
ncbi:threonine dehydrogenase-like Zn-dependent dehydrogenase [Amycolatopsis bartoniae]|uniref:Zinc-binding dehydrogenase n=1 Tax=Amycolatopsis bartoniae TaxID=941986 RepID=A0A8H9IW41_9PSEU|nr:threonine dehydrogenase-like Zn-dependent dehydrogenase [Amycolatopsis bartoniae]GHF68551.1 hypothetical protein GCM10017566_47970 [Amycolatopsis bartoniae]